MKRTVPGRKDKTTRGTGFGRNSTFGRKTPMQKDEPRKGSSFSSSRAKPTAKPKAPPSERDRVKKAAISALNKAKRIAARTGVELSEWEDEFLGSVADRIRTYGRAFGDADKGDLAAPLSVMQGRKLKEITRKAKGEKRAFGRRRKSGDPAAEDAGD